MQLTATTQVFEPFCFEIWQRRSSFNCNEEVYKNALFVVYDKYMSVFGGIFVCSKKVFANL